MSHRALWGMVLLAATACGGSDEDKARGEGGSGGGDEAGCLQVPTCTPSLNPVRAICVEDECAPVGARGPGDERLESDMRIFSRYPSQVGGFNVKSLALTVLHPTTPLGGTLTCAQLLAMDPKERRNAGRTNAVIFDAINATFVAGNDTVTAPLYGVPVNDPGVEYLVLSELFSGARNSVTGLNEGAVVAEGCGAGLVAPEGRFGDHPDDERYTFLVDLRMRR